ncbi:unnamed protein product [Cylicocyclus nassatus]|uniref:Uncharacterized protein n=1 Tax=Cylicocyclus nassatus TaxID=53992 RepID=A0AA36GMH7_CYLNA|nr:unnamed protein product [Cylicocyclus nassatus]
MRFFKLTILLLTVLVILSAVDVGECGFLDFIKKIGRGLKKVAKGIGKAVLGVGKVVVKVAPVVAMVA